MIFPNHHNADNILGKRQLQGIVSILVVMIGLVFIWKKIYLDDEIYFLIPSTHAEWIISPLEFSPMPKVTSNNITFFRKQFDVERQLDNVDLNFRAFKELKLFLDDQLVFESTGKHKNWKKLYDLSLKSITAGNHELVLMISNNHGPPAAMFYSDKLELATDDTWKYRLPDGSWSPAQLAQKRLKSERSTIYKSTFEAFMDASPFGIVLLALISILIKFRDRFDKFITLETARYFCFGGWVIFAVNRLLNSRFMGFDGPAHLEYIDFIATKWSIPFATDGWEMFQSPLYYIIGAIFLKFFNLFLSAKLSYHMLSLIPLLCMLAHIEIGYRCAKLTFPGNRFSQLITMGFCAFAPLSLYTAHFVGNEPLAAALSAWVVLLCIQSIVYPDYVKTLKGSLLLGACLGLALLTKVSTALLLPPVLAVMSYSLIKTNSTKKEILISIGSMLLILFLFSGWYYIRNWLEMGSFFVGGWDPKRGLFWWQHPGFRTWQDFFVFGNSLIYPIYSSTYGLWDSIYSTFWIDGLLGVGVSVEQVKIFPWNNDFMLSVVLLSLLPTIAIVSGAAITTKNIFKGNVSAVMIFCLACCAIYLAGIIYFFLLAPTYVSAKAGYSLGILPCLGIMCAYGFANIARKLLVKYIIAGIMSWWAMFSYIAYFSSW